jgi:Tfp pilus assembly protein PilE
MALIPCPECEREISAEAETCPHCGHPLQDPSDDLYDSDESLLEAYVGPNWFDHYRSRFLEYLADQRTAAAWNWAAFFVPGWYLYRKLYGWWFAFIGLWIVCWTIQGVAAIAGSESLALIAWIGGMFGVPILQGMFGDFLVYGRGIRVIEETRRAFSDREQVRRAVSNRGGTSLGAAALLIFLVIVVWIGILAAIAIPKFASTKEKAYQAAMRSDLRNLAAAQEGFFADSVRYAVSLEELADVYQTTVGVEIELVPTTDGYLATATHSAASARCQLYIGTRPADVIQEVLEEGDARCSSSVGY